MDPVERREARILRLLALVGVLWAALAIGLEIARHGWRTDPGYLVLGAFLLPCVLLSLGLLWRGCLTAATWLFVASVELGTGAVFAWGGLTYGTHVLRLVAIPLVVSALILGRRGVWTVFAVNGALLGLGALREHGLFGGAARPTLPPPLGLLGGTLIFSFLLTLVLDQLGAWLHESLTEARESAQRLQVAFATFPDVILMARTDGVITSVNEGFTHVTGWTEGEALGRTTAELGLWWDPAQRAVFLEDVLAGRTIENLEVVIRRKDGSPRTCLLSAREIAVDGERCVLGMARDITERRRAEEERAQLREQLQAAQKMEALGQLAAGIAHDFNNLLSVVRASAALMEAQVPAGSPLRSDLDDISAAADRGALLTRQLLAFSRREVLPVGRCDAAEALRAVSAMLPRVLGSSVHVEAAIPDALGPIPLSEAQVQQVLLNLAINARQAMPEGGTLGLVAERRVLAANGVQALGAGEYLAIRVRDSGIGMGDEVRSRLFTPFFTTKPAGIGTGLGLSTSLGIVRTAGGTMTVESAPGAGTTFTIWLPAGEETTVAQPAKRAAVGGRATVLVVDDEPEVLEVLARIVASAGHRVLPAAGASDALRKAEQETVDALVTDMVLREGCGLDVLEGLRRRRPQVGIVVTSGLSAALRPPADSGIEFVPKPFTPDQILKALDRALGRP